MEWWEKGMFSLGRVWSGVATRLGIRKSGLLKLSQDVRTCEYEDVQVMWEMLRRSETEATARSSSPKKRKRALWKVVEWASRTPYLCRSF